MHSSSSVLLGAVLILAMFGAFSSVGPPEPAVAPVLTPIAPVAVSTGLLTVRKDVREVTLSFIVKDEDGRPVTSLRPQQVRVYSDGSPVGALNAFYSEKDLPLRLSVLVDTSDSVTPNFLNELKATDQFAARLVRPQIDRISWTSFASHMETYPEPSGTFLRPATFGRNAIGQTALYDAVYETAKREQARGPDGCLTRKALLLLSDGEDNWSRRSLDDAIKAAQEAGFTIYCLTAHEPRTEHAGDAPLRKLAAATGGRAYILSSYEHAGGVLEEIEKELRSQYLLTFAPTSKACGLHSVKIVPSDRAFTVQSRNAYYVDGC